MTSPSVSSYFAVYGPTYGAAWPYSTPLDVRAEINIGGAAVPSWQDITQYVLQREGAQPPIQISRGRPDETATANPCEAQCQLNNKDGRFTAKNPTGPYYPILSRNTPLRFSIPGTGSYGRIENDRNSYFVSTNAHTNLPTGDQDIRIDLNLSSYEPSVLASWWGASGGRAWALLLNGDGTLAFLTSTDGTLGTLQTLTSTNPVPLGKTCLRVTFGSGTSVATFWSAASGNIYSGPYTQIGNQVGVAGGPSTTLFSSTAALSVGYNSTIDNDKGSFYLGCTGEIYDFIVFSGFFQFHGGMGVIVARAAFNTLAAGTFSWTGPAGDSWALGNNATIDNRSYRYHGEMSSLPTSWDPSGTDVWVQHTSGGILRRIQQGNTPTPSVIRRYVESQTGAFAPVFYWGLEDGVNSGQLGSGITGFPPMTLVSGTPKLAADTSFICSQAIMQMNNSEWYGAIPNYTDTGNLCIRFLFNPDSSLPVQLGYIMRIDTVGQYGNIYVTYQPGTGYQIGSNVGVGNIMSSFVNVTGPVMVSVELVTTAGSIQPTLRILDVSGVVHTASTVPPQTGFVGRVFNIYLNPFLDNPNAFFNILNSSFGHIFGQAAVPPLSTIPASVIQAWAGETAGNRFARLCTENNIQSRVYGFPSTTSQMGAQSQSTLTQLLQECETADMGLIYEPRKSFSLGYRTLNSMCSQAPKVTFDYLQAHLGQMGGDGELTPTYDDQQTRNDITVQRSSTQNSVVTVGGQRIILQTQIASGSYYQAILNDGSRMSVSPPPVGVGDYNTQIGANVFQDVQLFDIGGWRLHVGTVDEERYPEIPLNMARTELVGLYGQLLEPDVGDYMQVINTPVWVAPPPVRQLIFGIVEEIGGFWFLMGWQCVPESPFEVGVLDDAVYGHCDTDGAQLQFAITSTTSTFTVNTTGPSGTIWTTSVVDFPFDIMVEGERMTVASITGSSSPQTFLVTRSVNGVSKAHLAGAPVQLFQGPVLAVA